MIGVNGVGLVQVFDLYLEECSGLEAVVLKLEDFAAMANVSELIFIIFIAFTVQLIHTQVFYCV